jgi:hypothetical protein
MNVVVAWSKPATRPKCPADGGDLFDLDLLDVAVFHPADTCLAEVYVLAVIEHGNRAFECWALRSIRSSPGIPQWPDPCHRFAYGQFLS